MVAAASQAIPMGSGTHFGEDSATSGSRTASETFVTQTRMFHMFNFLHFDWAMDGYKQIIKLRPELELQKEHYKGTIRFKPMTLYNANELHKELILITIKHREDNHRPSIMSAEQVRAVDSNNFKELWDLHQRAEQNYFEVETGPAGLLTHLHKIGLLTDDQLAKIKELAQAKKFAEIHDIIDQPILKHQYQTRDTSAPLRLEPITIDTKRWHEPSLERVPEGASTKLVGAVTTVSPNFPSPGVILPVLSPFFSDESNEEIVEVIEVDGISVIIRSPPQVKRKNQMLVHPVTIRMDGSVREYDAKTHRILPRRRPKVVWRTEDEKGEDYQLPPNPNGLYLLKELNETGRMRPITHSIHPVTIKGLKSEEFEDNKVSVRIYGGKTSAGMSWILHMNEDGIIDPKHKTPVMRPQAPKVILKDLLNLEKARVAAKKFPEWLGGKLKSGPKNPASATA